MPLHTLFLAQYRIFLFCIIAVVYCSFPTLSAQTLASSATFSWQTSATWGVSSGFPGSSLESTTAIVRLTSQSVTLLDATPPFAVSTLHILHAPTENSTLGTLTLRPTVPSSTMVNTTTLTLGQIRFSTFGAVLVIGAGLRVVLQGDILTPTSATSTTTNLAFMPPPRIILEPNATLELMSTRANVLSGVDIRGSGLNSTIVLRNGFNRGFLPSANFCSTTHTLQARLLLGGTFSLNGNLCIATEGTLDFSSTGTSKIILGASNLTAFAPITNASQERYVVTNGAGALRLSSSGTIRFHIGPTSTIYSPMLIIITTATAEFSVRAITPTSPVLPPLASTSGSLVRLGAVVVRWDVTQHTNIVPGSSVMLTPQWAASSEGAGGFNRMNAIVHRYNADDLTIAQSSIPAASSRVPGLTNHSQLSLIITQTMSPGLLVNSPILVTSEPQPTLSGFAPTSFSAGGAVRLFGRNFVNVTAIRFGGVDAASFRVAPLGDTITAIVGNGASGSVVVVQKGGSIVLPSSNSFSIPTAVISSVIPPVLVAGQGDVVLTILGRNFGANPTVNASSNQGQGRTITRAISSTSLTITLPGLYTRLPGTISLTITSSDRFAVSTSITVQMPTSVQAPTRLTAQDGVTDMVIAPNPATDNISIHAVLSTVARVAFSVRDVFGREVMLEEAWCEAGLIHKEMDISRLSSGVYSVEMRENGRVCGVQRFVKR